MGIRKDWAAHLPGASTCKLPALPRMAPTVREGLFTEHVTALAESTMPPPLATLLILPILQGAHGYHDGKSGTWVTLFILTRLATGPRLPSELQIMRN